MDYVIANLEIQGLKVVSGKKIVEINELKTAQRGVV